MHNYAKKCKNAFFCAFQMMLSILVSFTLSISGLEKYLPFSNQCPFFRKLTYYPSPSWADAGLKRARRVRVNRLGF